MEVNSQQRRNMDDPIEVILAREAKKPKLEADIDDLKDLIRAQQVQIAEAAKAALAAANAAAAVASAFQQAAQANMLPNAAPPMIATPPMIAVAQQPQLILERALVEQSEELREVPNEIK